MHNRKRALAPLLAAGALVLAASAGLTQGKPGERTGAAQDAAARKALAQCWRAGYWTPAHAIMECDPAIYGDARSAGARTEKQPVADSRTRTQTKEHRR
jgi:OOP family OmpA-OmpF porin